jgi:hypothetical protein
MLLNTGEPQDAKTFYEEAFQRMDRLLNSLIDHGAVNNFKDPNGLIHQYHT